MTYPVQTNQLTKHFGRIRAVEDLDLTVKAGEVYGFLGPNGAGKTTTLRMLLGLIRPTAGSVQLFGRPPGRRFLDRVGALVEGPAFYPYLSGRDNLRALARHAGVGGSRVDAVLDLVDLSERSQDRFATYSLGMKQRLGLAAALLKEPDMLILDEPTNGLDPAGMADMRVTIRRLAASGCTVLLSSHLLGEVQQICDRVGVISAGRLVAEMPVAEMGGGRTLRVVARPIDRALEHVVALLGADRVQVDGDALELTVELGEAARINSSLVSAGVAVSELRTHEPDLERAFLELTGGISHVG
jgi:ABC-2 type transport system ATP-binding protein